VTYWYLVTCAKQELKLLGLIFHVQYTTTNYLYRAIRSNY